MHKDEQFIRDNFPSLMAHPLVKSKTSEIRGDWSMHDNEVYYINIEFGIVLENGANCLRVTG